MILICKTSSRLISFKNRFRNSWWSSRSCSRMIRLSHSWSIFTFRSRN